MGSQLRKIKTLLLRIRETVRLARAFLVYNLTGNTPAWAGRSLIDAFCLTGGRSNDWMSTMISLRFPPRKLEIAPRILSPLSESELGKTAAALRENGYAILEQKLPAEVCDRLLQFALAEPAILRQTDKHDIKQRKLVYDQAQPQAVIYDFEKRAVLANGAVQDLLVDPVVLSIAQAYFRSEPIADMMSMWWTTAYGGVADGEAAQLYHFDMDRIKWLKFFFYLTDVEAENGPHFFVAGSHRTQGIPRALLNKGYVRLADEEVAGCFPRENFMQFAAPRGTILVEDTRGLHKGQHIARGHRLVLQFQYSNSLFGPETERAPISVTPGSAIDVLAKQSPRLLSGYDLLR